MILAPYPRSRDTQNPRKKLRKCKKKKDFSVFRFWHILKTDYSVLIKNRLFSINRCSLPEY